MLDAVLLAREWPRAALRRPSWPRSSSKAKVTPGQPCAFAEHISGEADQRARVDARRQERADRHIGDQVMVDRLAQRLVQACRRGNRCSASAAGAWYSLRNIEVRLRSLRAPAVDRTARAPAGSARTPRGIVNGSGTEPNK